jgi:16S rRNA (guanine1207-N2)-methyltransferase
MRGKPCESSPFLHERAFSRSLNALESRPDRRWMRDVTAPRNAVLQALLHPFAEGALAHAADTLFMNARADVALPPQAAGWSCVQGFKPWADALAAAGLHSQPGLAEDAARFACVLLPLPRQRDLARAQMVEGLRRLAPGGVLVLAQANDAGAKSATADLARLVSPLTVESKYHCRVAWTAPDARRLAPALEDDWLRAAAPRAVPGTPWLARPGVFARDRIDAGSALLAEHLPGDFAGAVADLGAGWGFLSATLLQRCPGIRTLDLFEADAEALALAQTNLATLAHPAARRFHWHDVRAGLPAGFDAIVSNPPFHVDGADDPQLGRDFIAAAAAALRPGGRFWLVANRHLPYEAALAAGFATVREVARRDGFKVIEARAR